MSKTSEVTQHVKLYVGDTLQTGSGLKAYVAAKLPPEICKDSDGPYVVAILSSEENADPYFVQYFENGVPLYIGDGLAEYVLQPYSPFSTMQMDTPVMASVNGRGRLKHFHFAGMVDGVPYVWEDGRTSFTTKNRCPAKSIRVPDWKK